MGFFVLSNFIIVTALRILDSRRGKFLMGKVLTLVMPFLRNLQRGGAATETPMRLLKKSKSAAAVIPMV